MKLRDLQPGQLYTRFPQLLETEYSRVVIRFLKLRPSKYDPNHMVAELESMNPNARYKTMITGRLDDEVWLVEEQEYFKSSQPQLERRLKLTLKNGGEETIIEKLERTRKGYSEKVTLERTGQTKTIATWPTIEEAWERIPQMWRGAVLYDIFNTGRDEEVVDAVWEKEQEYFKLAVLPIGLKVKIVGGGDAKNDGKIGVVSRHWGKDPALLPYPNEVIFDDGNNGVYADDELEIIEDYFKLAQTNTSILGNSKDIQVGQKIVKIGSPEGIYNLVMFGVVSSGIRRIDDVRSDIFFIDLFLQPGDSGGPVYDTQGKVLGIARGAIIEASTGNGVNYVVSIDPVKAWLESEGIAFNEVKNFRASNKFKIGDRFKDVETELEIITDYNKGDYYVKYTEPLWSTPNQNIIRDLESIGIKVTPEESRYISLESEEALEGCEKIENSYFKLSFTPDYSEQEIEKHLAKECTTIDDLTDAGWLAPSGILYNIDKRKEHWQSVCSYDHISCTTDPFIERGFIRYVGPLGVELKLPPTSRQMRVLKQAERIPGFFYTVRKSSWKDTVDFDTLDQVKDYFKTKTAALDDYDWERVPILDLEVGDEISIFQSNAILVDKKINQYGEVRLFYRYKNGIEHNFSFDNVNLLFSRMKKNYFKLAQAPDPFTQAYLEAAIWASNDNEGEPLDKNYSVLDFTEEALEQIKEECQRFQSENAEELVVDNYLGTGDYLEVAGQDFFLTRNDHGSGFAIDGNWVSPADKCLTNAAKAFGEQDILETEDKKLEVYPKTIKNYFKLAEEVFEKGDRVKFRWADNPEEKGEVIYIKNDEAIIFLDNPVGTWDYDNATLRTLDISPPSSDSKRYCWVMVGNLKLEEQNYFKLAMPLWDRKELGHIRWQFDEETKEYKGYDPHGNWHTISFEDDKWVTEGQEFDKAIDAMKYEEKQVEPRGHMLTPKATYIRLAKPTKLYHITGRHRLDNILKNGLLPQKELTFGGRRIHGYLIAGVFLASGYQTQNTIRRLENKNFANFEDKREEWEDYVILEVTLPRGEVLYEDEEFSPRDTTFVYAGRIPSEWVRVINEDEIDISVLEMNRLNSLIDLPKKNLPRVRRANFKLAQNNCLVIPI